MICPVCSHEAVSFSRFLLVLNPRHLRCRHCGAELAWSAKWKRVFLWSLVVCLACAVVLSIVHQVTGLSLIIIFAAVIVAAVIFARMYWRSATYEKAM